MVWNGVRVHFLTKSNVRVIHILCRHAVNHKRSVSFGLFQMYILSSKDTALHFVPDL